MFRTGDAAATSAPSRALASFASASALAAAAAFAADSAHGGRNQIVSAILMLCVTAPRQDRNLRVNLKVLLHTMRLTGRRTSRIYTTAEHVEIFSGFSLHFCTCYFGERGEAIPKPG